MPQESAKQRPNPPNAHAPPCKIIALACQKGGTGKTTSCLNLGVGLAREGKRVLVCDLDAQADLTTALGWKDSDQLPVTLATLMENAVQDRAANPHDAILRHNEGVDLLPASLDLSAVEPPENFHRVMKLCEKQRRSGFYKNNYCAVQPRSVIVLKQSVGGFPAGTKLLWVTGDRCFHELGGLLDLRKPTTYSNVKLTFVPAENLFQPSEILGIDFSENSSFSENENFKRYSSTCLNPQLTR
ncbi:MAG: AAA family ATPase [Oscillospiraceae bacterium]|jgi:hypothetical protein|nr:AAA family ATPase [Oscillospiraceae bacterium]